MRIKQNTEEKMAHWWFGCSGSHAIKGKHQRPDYRMYSLSPSPHCWEKHKGNQQNRKKHLKHTRQSHRYYSFASSWPVFISQVLCAGLSVQHPSSSGSLNTQPLREEGAQGQPQVTGWVEQRLRPRGCTLPGGTLQDGGVDGPAVEFLPLTSTSHLDTGLTILLYKLF